MSQLGEWLRQTREQQGISLAQAAVETRILQQWLIALEEGAFERLPNSVVTRGFLRNYAQYLGLSADELLELYRQERGISDPIRVVSTSNSIRPNFYVLPNFLGVFFVTIALVGLMYVVLSAFGRIGSRSDIDQTHIAAGITGTTTTTTLAPSDGDPVGMVVNEPEATPTSLPTIAAPTPTPMPSPSPTPLAPIVIEVSIEPDAGESWLRVLTDGSIAYEQTMRGGEREVFLANREVFIRAGNPAVVQVNVNGRQRGTLGQSPGIPVNWYWPPQ